jgi:hypothetical protein
LLAGGRIEAPGQCLSDHCQAAVNGETLTVRKAEFGIVYTFIGARVLKVDHEAKCPKSAHA